MINDVDAAAGRTANGEAVSLDHNSWNVQEGRSYNGGKVLLAASRAKRTSLFANAQGVINSDDFASDHSRVTDRIRSLIWCIRILEEEAGRDQKKLDRMSYVMDTFLESIGWWMDDLDEVGELARKLYAAEGE